MKKFEKNASSTKCPVLINQQQFAVYHNLQRGKGDAQNDADGQAPDQVLAVVFMHQCVVCPCHGTARQQQDSVLISGRWNASTGSNTGGTYSLPKYSSIG